MKWLRDLVGRIVLDLQRNLWSLLLYDAIFAGLNFFLLMPLLSWAVSFMASSSGRLSVNNAELLSFLFSLRGILFILVVGSLTAVILHVKHAGMILIVWETRTGRAMGAPQAFREVIRRLPQLAALGSYHVVAHAVALAPFAILGTVVYRLVFSSMPVYFLFIENPAARGIGLIGVLLLVALFVALHGVVYLHWVLSLPAVLVDDLSPGAAPAHIRGLLKGTKWRTGVVVLVFWSGMVLSPLVLAEAFYWLGGSVFTRLPSEHRLVMPVVLTLMGGYLTASFFGEFVTVAFNSVMVTHVYDDLRVVCGSGTVKVPTRHPQRPVHRRRIAAFLVLTAMASLAVAATILSGFDFQDNVRITAHRGSSSSAPENTLAAIHRAIEDGADYAEVDVRLTADGLAVLMHDRDLFRVAGVKKNVAELSYEELRTLDVGSWFSPRFRGERVPLLSEVVAVCKGQIRLNIEIKPGAPPRQIAERVVRILHDQDAVGECVVSSASIDILEQVRSLDPGIRIGYIIAHSVGRVTSLDVDFISVSSRLATPGLVDAARAAGKEVHVWTVNRPRQMAALIDLGVDNLITDLPLEARALLDERAAMSRDELLFVKIRHWFLRRQGPYLLARNGGMSLRDAR
ncbi:MAG TPA: glycerophosphodiester phosphodiesterase [Sedimentisphaerales bacterium]|mgnify:CR=1 FL=1|nr:glycerophosphodiester phosphodiesterase [Sedimentisphaerales bacterium]